MSYYCVDVVPRGLADDPYKDVSTTPEAVPIEEPHDHGMNYHVPVRNILLQYWNNNTDKWSNLISSDSKINGNLYITDSRIITRCVHYDKGGTWYGGLISSAILTGAERVIANVRTRNQVLIGHLRYEWLEKVMYSKKMKMLDDEQVAFLYRDEDKSRYRLILSINTSFDCSRVANDILHKACQYRLAMTDDKNDLEREFFLRYLSDEIEYNSNPDVFSDIGFPSKYYAPLGREYRPPLSGYELPQTPAENNLMQVNQGNANPEQLLPPTTLVQSEVSQESQSAAKPYEYIGESQFQAQSSVQFESQQQMQPISQANGQYNNYAQPNIQENISVNKAPVPQNFCMKCGCKIDAESFIFCPNCGNRIM